MYARLKRGLDACGSAIGLVLLSPVLGIIALLILCRMGRPVLFRQLRPGLLGKPFAILKFRTMLAAAEGEATQVSDEKRLTPIGRALRSTSLDELPELWNVLLGQMSLVGPRPLMMQYMHRYNQEQSRRHEVRPGITGLAQISGRNAITWDEKFALDIYYIDNRSIWLDIKILAKTVWMVIRREGISAPGDATMPEFRGSPPPSADRHSIPIGRQSETGR